MRLTLRRTLFLAVLGLGLALLVGAGISARAMIESRLEVRVLKSLSRSAHLAAAALEGMSPAETAHMDAAADRLGRTLGVHVSVFGPNAKLLGDSALSPAALRSAPEPDDLPEVRTALGGSEGSWQRTVDGADAADLFVAVPYVAAGGSGAVRVGTSLDTVQETLADLRLVLVLGTLYALVAAIAVSALATHLSRRALERAITRVDGIAQGGRGAPSSEGFRETLARGFGAYRRAADNLEQAVENLAEERSWLEGVLHGMDEGVLALDPAGRVALLNGRAASLLALDERALGRPALDVIEPECLRDMAARAATGVPSEGQFPVGPPPCRTVAARASLLPGRHGVVVVLRDVTEMRRLETVRRDFFANASHELRTPVAVIRATTETLLDGALDDRQRSRSFVEAIDRNSERLSRLVADVLDISRIEAGAYRVDIRALRVAPVARHVAALLEPAWGKRGQSLSLCIAEELEVLADASALEHVLFNLLSNAVNYTPEGGHVRIVAEPFGARVRIHVEDDGPGIPEPHRSRVFERFYRVDPARSREMGGTGLGLAIVRHLVSAMSGTVEVGAASPHGAVFTVSLPAAPAPAEEVPVSAT